ncbi:MAG: reductive dehalogenase domain-containing protein [Chrysiogenia bacterium]
MIMHWIDWIGLLAGTLFFLLFAVTSYREGEKRAVGLSILFFVANAVSWGIMLHWRQIAVVQLANVALLLLLVLFSVISLLKFFPTAREPDLSRIDRADERDHMFSRNQLKFDNDHAELYYAWKPHLREGDEKIHSRPELGHAGHTYYSPCFSRVFGAAFSYLERTRSAGSGEAAAEKKSLDPSIIRSAIMRTARYFGAVDVGITSLQPHHFYSHAGRRAENWGETIAAARGSAVVIVVAMDWRMIAQSPTLPVILESARQYVESAKIAAIIAEYIRGLGYRARAHSDGNYEVLCVPLAVEAGLGELGRLGLLIHPVYGPCVRLAVVSTELELEPTPKRAIHVDNFCRICKKCAANCPTRAIVNDDEPHSRSFRHWSIRQESCYAFWKQIGTDCALCIRSCPYTKPDTLLHRLVRFYVSRNSFNQHLALLLDDFFYGRKKRIFPANPGEIIRF